MKKTAFPPLKIPLTYVLCQHCVLTLLFSAFLNSHLKLLSSCLICCIFKAVQFLVCNSLAAFLSSTSNVSVDWAVNHFWHEFESSISICSYFLSRILSVSLSEGCQMFRLQALGHFSLQCLCSDIKENLIHLKEKGSVVLLWDLFFCHFTRGNPCALSCLFPPKQGRK